MALVEPGNAMPLGSGAGNQGSKERSNGIVAKTKELAFPEGPVISLENFDSHGDKGAGWENSLAEMQNLSGKELQESYRAKLPESKKYTADVSTR